MTTPITISITYGVCPECFSRSWNVVLEDSDGTGDCAANTWYCGTKAAAIKEARKVFNDYTTAEELRVESPRAGTFKTIRKR